MRSGFDDDDDAVLFCPAGRLGLGTQDTRNRPQQVPLPGRPEAQRVLCGVDCSMIIGAGNGIVACGSNRW